MKCALKSQIFRSGAAAHQGAQNTSKRIALVMLASVLSMDNTTIRENTTFLTLALPLEILHHILQNLDVKSLLAVGQVRAYSGLSSQLTDCHGACQYRPVSLERNLWYGFVQELESRPGHSRLETPWTNYTGKELAQGFVKVPHREGLAYARHHQCCTSYTLTFVP